MAGYQSTAYGYEDLDPIPERYGVVSSVKYQEIVADAGYESEENYLFLEGNGQLAYINPRNYEISKPENTVRISGGWKT